MNNKFSSISSEGVKKDQTLYIRIKSLSDGPKDKTIGSTHITISSLDIDKRIELEKRFDSISKN